MNLFKKKPSGYELDMTNGSLIPKVIMFAVPLILSSVLQLLYNAADVIVVGRFVGAEALAAVGSTGSLVNLIVNVFLGLSIGTNVLAARYYGAGDQQNTSETVHTSVMVSILGGILIGIFGFVLGGTFLRWMGSPDDVLPLATRYIRIYFIGMPFNMVYNFGAAILRAVGDTKRPLYFLTFSGIINVILNLFFVIVLGIGVAGVALATIISQAISASLVILCLVRTKGYVHLDIRKLGISKEKLIGIAKIGLPAGFQGACFSISNVLLQSTINSFGSTVIAGNSASSNIEGFVYVSMNAFHQAAVTFTGANIGAGKTERVGKTLRSCLLLVITVGLMLGIAANLGGRTLLGIYTTEAAVVDAGIRRMHIICYTYFLCGILDVICGVMRGMGHSVEPMAATIVGVCMFRLAWIYILLPHFEGTVKLQVMYACYPASWIITALAEIIFCIYFIRKLPGQEPGTDIK